MAWWSQREQASRWPPSAAVRHAVMARNTLSVELLVAQPGAVLFPKTVSPSPNDVRHLYGRPHQLIFLPMIAAACLANAGELQTLQRVEYCL
jgi:hypothetical protein